MSHVSEQQRSPKKRPVHLRAIVRDPPPWAEPLSLLGLPLQQGQNVQGDDGPFPTGDRPSPAPTLAAATREMRRGLPDRRRMV
jgi:hypothetical protein